MTRGRDRGGISRNRARLIQTGVPQAQLQVQTMAPRQRHCPACDIKKREIDREREGKEEEEEEKNVRSLACNHMLLLSERSSSGNNLEPRTKEARFASISRRGNSEIITTRLLRPVF